MVAERRLRPDASEATRMPPDVGPAPGSHRFPATDGRPPFTATEVEAPERPSWERGRPARTWAEGPPVFKRARCPRSQERHRLSHRLSRGDSTRSTHAGSRSVPGTAGAPQGARASRPQVGRRPTGVQAGKMPALPGKAPPVSSSLPKRLDALDPRRPPLGPRDRGRPARKWAAGPQVFKRARCPRSQERHRLSHRLSRSDSTRSTHAGPRSVPGTAGAPLGARASRPHVGRRPTGVFKRARCPRSQGALRNENCCSGSREPASFGVYSGVRGTALLHAPRCASRPGWRNW